jgi:hypothetical protein
MYEKKISCQYPGLIVLVLDDSGSMADNLPGTSDAKFKWVERYVGLIFNELLARSSEVKGNGVVIKPRYCLVVIKYGSIVEIWGDPGMDIKTAVEKFTNDGNSLGLGGHFGGTDTEAGIQEAYEYLKKAVKQEKFKDSFPPMVLHLTDGMSHTDAQPVIEQIKQLSTSDGNVLVVNAFIGTDTSLSYKGPEDFPGYVDVSEAGPSTDNIKLFDMSSAAPQCIVENLKSQGTFPNIRDGSRLFFDVRTKEMLKNVLQTVASLGASRMAR